MSEKKKISRDTVPDDFSVALALTDAVPVVFFGATVTALGLLLNNALFLVGALLAFFAGAAKVLWKFIVVLKKKNVWWLFLQMRILMPIAFLLMVTGPALFGGLLGKTDYSLVWQRLSAFPQAGFFIAGIVGMLLMMIFAFTLDASDKKSNWIEQLTNSAAQICFFVGAVLALIN